MNNVQVSFDTKYEDYNDPVEHQEIKFHTSFYIKQLEVTRKVQFVTIVHTMDTTTTMIYAYLVLRESAYFELLVLYLNDFDVLSTDIQNAYLNATPHDKAWSQAGSEFG